MKRIRESLALLAVLALVSGCRCQTTTPSIPSVDEMVAELENLDFDTFLETSYTQLLLRDPELITELGLSDQLGLKSSCAPRPR